MTSSMRRTEARAKRQGRSTRPQTRAVPAFVQLVPVGAEAGQREAASDAYWPSGGIDYRSIEVPTASLSEDAALRREVRDLFGDDD